MSFFFSFSKSSFFYTLLCFALLILSTSFSIKNDEDFVFITKFMAKKIIAFLSNIGGPAWPPYICYAMLSGVISPSL